MNITKTGVFTIAGRPNVGKSTLANRIAGEKIAIVSHKPQTTRSRISAICNRGETQLVFLDTPGYHKPKNALDSYMDRIVETSVADNMDAVILMVEPIANVGKQEEALIRMIKASGAPAVLVINKCDTVKKPELPGHLSDKLLLSTERVELRDDYRGIPETNYYKSSANEYFVDGIGWLDNDAYERELKLSELSAKNFYSKVTKINADCIDAEGTVSHVDMSPQDYQLLTDKTYTPENRLALEMAKAKLAERMNHAGLEEKPVEQYAVRQNTNNRYAICTISADGLVTD